METNASINNKILICGDSFSADWRSKYVGAVGWPNLLSKKYNVTNISQAGCSEYKIWLQLQKNKDLNNYQTIIVWHTSPYRIPVNQHPLHMHDILHKNCDLIYEDIRASGAKEITCVREFYEKYYDLDYANFVHHLILQHELAFIAKNFSGKSLHIFTGAYTGIGILNYISMEKIVGKHRGLINHLSDLGNQFVYEELVRWLTNH